MKKVVVTLLLPLVAMATSCGESNTPNQQATLKNARDTIKDLDVGGQCDGCEVMFEGMPPADKIRSEIQLSPQNEPGDKMEISGTVFMKDGKTPAKEVIIYLYHTDATGHYTASADQVAGRKNGHLRGWVKTDAAGEFKFHSIRPNPYPNDNIPAHIHLVVKEKGKKHYYIDEVLFDDDRMITDQMKKNMEGRGGNLLIHLSKDNDKKWVGNLKITLGLNIPNYP